MAKTQILVAEDESIVAEDIKKSLQNMGYVIPSVVSSGEKAVEEIENSRPDLVLMDIVLKGEMDGIEAAAQIRSRFDIPVVYLTAYSDEKTLERAKITEPFGYITKPFKERELCINIEIALYEHKMEKKLKESKEWFSKTLHSIGDAVIASDSNGYVIFMNPCAVSLTGWKPADVQGKLLEDVLNITREESDPEKNPVLISKNGMRIPVEYNGNQITDDRGNIIGSVLIVRDITERQRAEKLHMENIRLALAYKIKTDFLATMSHELRTPLNSIIGFSELLKRKFSGELNEEQEHSVDNIIISGKHMLKLINDILYLSKLESGKAEQPLIEKIALPAAIDEALTLIREKAAKHNVIMKKEFDHRIDFIEADRRGFMQILLNLLDNAVKFSKKEDGIVTVTAKKDGNMVRISVSDNGIGISENDMGKLFKKFQQIDSGISRRYGGTGLGLAISKQIVELHGGKIWAESKYGEGSTFTFLLPLAAKKENK